MRNFALKSLLRINVNADPHYAIQIRTNLRLTDRSQGERMIDVVGMLIFLNTGACAIIVLICMGFLQ